MNKQKIFIIGLPRTGTTSVCSAMLNLGYTVAHTAYVQKAFDNAQVIADTPIFADYQTLDIKYPNSRFIYLDREPSLWVPSIKQLLNRMASNVLRSDGGFNPNIKRCFTEIFSPYNLTTINDDNFLIQRYKLHQDNVYSYFEHRQSDLLTIDISKPDSYTRMLSFLGMNLNSFTSNNTKSYELNNIKKGTKKLHNIGFEQLNKGSKVTGWKDIKHPLKIESTKNGRIEIL